MAETHFVEHGSAVVAGRTIDTDAHLDPLPLHQGNTREAITEANDCPGTVRNTASGFGKRPDLFVLEFGAVRKPCPGSQPSTIRENRKRILSHQFPREVAFELAGKVVCMKTAIVRRRNLRGPSHETGFRVAHARRSERDPEHGMPARVVVCTDR